MKLHMSNVTFNWPARTFIGKKEVNKCFGLSRFDPYLMNLSNLGDVQWK